MARKPIAKYDPNVQGLCQKFKFKVPLTDKMMKKLVTEIHCDEVMVTDTEIQFPGNTGFMKSGKRAHLVKVIEDNGFTVGGYYSR